MIIYYLYIKTHNITGLRYLGQTKSPDPHKYKGSGKYWLDHLKKHGPGHSTQILLETTSKHEIKKWGMYYSNKWDVVKSKDNNGRKLWANLVKENGDGLDPEFARKLSLEKVQNGTHPFVGGEISRKTTKRRLEDGTHHFLSEKFRKSQSEKAKFLLQENKHNFQIKDLQKILNLKRIQNGTHNLLGGHTTKKQLLDGTHSSQKKWECEYCRRIGYGTSNYSRWHGVNCKFKPD